MASFGNEAGKQAYFRGGCKFVFQFPFEIHFLKTAQKSVGSNNESQPKTRCTEARQSKL